MSELAEIKKDITDTKAELTDAKRKLAKAEVDKDESAILKWEARRDKLEALLTEQQKKENLLLANQGKFTLLSLIIAYSNPLYSIFLPHMMPYNACFHFLSASASQPAPVPTGMLLISSPYLRSMSHWFFLFLLLL